MDTDSRCDPILSIFHSVNERVEAMEPGGDLEAVLEQGREELTKKACEEWIAARAARRQDAADAAASGETPRADFPPSGLPPL